VFTWHDFAWHKAFLQDFCKFRKTGNVLVADARPHHVTAWLDGHPKWTSSRLNPVIAVMRAFSWATGGRSLRLAHRALGE
jgi:hypothetical protein